MEQEKIKIGQMILIGSTGQNSGKTTLAAELIRQWRGNIPIIGLKITTIKQKDGCCHRGETGCTACTNINNNYELSEETSYGTKKDTSVLLTAGAEKVFWMKSLASHLQDGIKEFLKQTPENALILCESNSLRKFVEPGCFIMMKNTKSTITKPSAEDVMDLADLLIENDFGDSIKIAAKKLHQAAINGRIDIKLEKD